MKSHPELYDSSLELEDLVKKYTNNNDYIALENTLLELLHTYEWLNFYNEDEYLEQLINTHQRLIDSYLKDNKTLDAYNSYMSIMEAYDDLIQLDKNDEKIKNNHINNLQSIYSNMKELIADLGVNDNVKMEFPRLKKYLD